MELHILLLLGEVEEVCEDDLEDELVKGLRDLVELTGVTFGAEVDALAEEDLARTEGEADVFGEANRSLPSLPGAVGVLLRENSLTGVEVDVDAGSSSNVEPLGPVGCTG